MVESKVSIVISSLNRASQLGELLTKINNLGPEIACRLTCYVCEQGEKLGIDARVFNNLTVKFISTTSRGISLGRNACLDALMLDEDIVLFLDDDATIDKEFFSRMSFYWKKYSKAGAISGRILDPSTGEEISRYMNRKEGKLDLLDLDVVMSSCLTVDAELIRKHRLRFDERLGVGAFYGGSEESEFTYQILLLGKCVYYVPGLTIFHSKYRHEDFSTFEVKERSFSYGLGRGALLKKILRREISRKTLQFFLLNYVRPILGLLYHSFRLNKSGQIFYWFTLKGRITGFIKFQN